MKITVHLDLSMYRIDQLISLARAKIITKTELCDELEQRYTEEKAV